MPENIRYISDIPYEQRICLFGAGLAGQELFALLKRERKDLTVVFFVDTYKKGKIKGKNILHPEELSRVHQQFDLILVASRDKRFRKEMEMQLEGQGLSNYLFLHPLFPQDISQGRQEGTLLAVYDLDISPPTFDIITFLCHAELVRRQQDFDSLKVIIIGPNHNRYGAREEVAWRIRNLVIPCCWLMPSCRRVCLCRTREDAVEFLSQPTRAIFPEDYTLDNPTSCFFYKSFHDIAKQSSPISLLQATSMSRKLITEWIKQQNIQEDRLVSITLREYGHPPERNSTIEAWKKFALDIYSRGYTPIFIRDTYQAFAEPLFSETDLPFFPELPWNIELRMAFYEQCLVNMFVGSGPAVLCVQNLSTRYLLFKIQVQEALNASDNYLNWSAFPPGGQFYGSSSLRRIVWEDDSLPVLRKEFDQFIHDYTANESHIP